MKILQINKFYHIVGGVDRYFFNVSNLLKHRGHTIAYFSMRHLQNVPSPWSDYFVDFLDFQKHGVVQNLRKIGRMMHSMQSKKRIAKLLDVFPADVAHVHAIYHQISPSILPELKKRNIPIVQSLGDYHLIAPNYNLFHDGAICEASKPDKFYKAIFHRCVKHSYAASFAEAFEKYLHLFLGWERGYVDYFLPRSKFLANTLIEYGIPKGKIIHVPHFIDAKKVKKESSRGDYVLFFGRLSPEKGLEFLLDVFQKLPDIPLKIAGRGPHEYVLKTKAKQLRLPNVTFEGFADGEKLHRLIEGSRFTILPSIWHEVFGLSILESFAHGKPVVASDIGGIPEVVTDRETGFLFEPKNREDCREKIRKLWHSDSLCIKMGKQARDVVEKKYTPEKHYAILVEIYKKARNL